MIHNALLRSMEAVQKEKKDVHRWGVVVEPRAEGPRIFDSMYVVSVPIGDRDLPASRLVRYSPDPGTVSLELIPGLQCSGS